MKRPLFFFGSGYIITSLLMPFYFNIRMVLTVSMLILSVGAVLLFVNTDKIIKNVKYIGVFLTGVSFALISLSLHLNNELIPLAKMGGKTVQIHATATEIEDYYGGHLINARATALNVQGIPKNFTISFTTYGELDIDEGESFRTTVLTDTPTYKMLGEQISDDVHLRGSAVSNITPSKEAAFPITQLSVGFRNYIAENILDSVDSDYSGLAVAIATGDERYMDYELTQSMNIAGTSHLTSVSGLHMSVVSFSFLGFLCYMGIPIRISSLLTLPVPILFACICGFSPSVTRSVIMILLSLIANIIFREADTLTSLAVAGLISLLLNPLIVHDVGFILSYSASLGLCIITPFLKTRFAIKSKNRFLNILHNLALQSVAAWLSLIVLTPLYFGYFSLVSPFANILCGLLAQLSLISSLITGVLGGLFGFTGGLFGFLSGALLMMIAEISVFVSKIPYSVIYVDTPTLLLTFILAAVIIYLAIYLKASAHEMCLSLLCSAILVFIGHATLYNQFYNGFGIKMGDGYFVLNHRGAQIAIVEDYSSYRHADVMADTVISTGQISGDFADYLTETTPKNLVYSDESTSTFLQSSLHESKILLATECKINLSDGFSVELTSSGDIKIVNNDLSLLKKSENYGIIVSNDADSLHNCIIDEDNNLIKHDNCFKITSHHDEYEYNYYIYE